MGLKVSCWDRSHEVKWIKHQNLQYHGILCIVEHYVEVFTKCFGRKSVCLVVWCHSGKDEIGRFLEALILCKALCGNFKGNSILVCDITWYREYSFLFLYIFFYISVCLLSILLFMCKTIFKFSLRDSKHLLIG